MPLFDYKCLECGETRERIVPSARVRAVTCTACGADAAVKQIPSRFGIIGPTTDTRGMFRRYQEATAEMDHAASKVEASTGEPVQTPSLWTQAKQTAQAMIATGESPVSSQASV